MSEVEMKFNKDGQIELDDKSCDGALGAEMANGNQVELHSHYEGKVWVILNTIKQDDGKNKVITMAYSHESMIAIVSLFSALSQALEKQRTGGLILPEANKNGFTLKK